MRLHPIRMSLALALLAVGPAATVREARAEASFRAEALTRVTITGFFDEAGIALGGQPDDLELFIFAEPFDDETGAIPNPDLSVIGVATATYDDSTTVVLPGDAGASLDAIIKGRAIGPNSGAFVRFFTVGYIEFTNSSTTATYEVEFGAEYSYFIEALADDQELQYADTLIQQFIGVYDVSSDSFDSIALDNNEYFNTSLGGGSLSLGLTQLDPFRMRLAPGEVKAVYFDSNVEGIAAVVPEPGSLALVGSGLGLVGLAGWSRGRRRAANSVEDTGNRPQQPVPPLPHRLRRRLASGSTASSRAWSWR